MLNCRFVLALYFASKLTLNISRKTENIILIFHLNLIIKILSYFQNLSSNLILNN